MGSRLVLSVVGMLLAILAAGCGPAAGATSTNPPLCDGVPSDIGGCASSRPRFSGDSCEAVAAEWVAAIDERVVPILEGPLVVDGKQRSGRIADVLVLSSILAGMHLDQLGLLPECDAPVFLAAAETGFSSELTNGIGDALYDGVPQASLDDWHVSLERAIRIIDEGE